MHHRPRERLGDLRQQRLVVAQPHRHPPLEREDPLARPAAHALEELDAAQPSGYIQLFSMNRFGPNTVLDGNVNNARTFQTWMWPLHVGTMTRLSGSQVRWHAITY